MLQEAISRNNPPAKPTPLPSHLRVIVPSEPRKLLFGICCPRSPAIGTNSPLGDSNMASQKAARTTRRLLKLASLGLAGLLAGFLSGCSSSPAPTSLATYSQPRSLDSLTSTYRPGSLYTHPTPDLRHPPIPHRIESWADRTPRPAASPFSTHLSSDPTLSTYAFTGSPVSSDPDRNPLTSQ
jgi:hypothetical protein